MFTDEEKENIIYCYEEYMLGHTKTLAGVFPENASNGVKKEAVGVILRYVVDHLFHMPPEDALAYFNYDIALQLRFDLLIGNGNRKIDDLSLCRTTDFRELFQLAYPGNIKFDLEHKVIAEVDRALGIGIHQRDEIPEETIPGKKRKTGKEERFPKNFFSDDKGEEKLFIALRYLVSCFLGYMTKEELYEFFADTPKARKWLHEVSLYKHASQHFPDPLDLYHYSLPYDEQNETLYYAYKSQAVYRKELKEAVIEK